ncbi:MAG: twin-arginine translocase TatA/TatE family subunit [bacterium]|jgi:sec-independent protein translocase protein TatA
MPIQANIFGTEMLVVLLIILLLFGAAKLPQLARSLGQSVKELKKGMQELEKDEEPVAQIETSKTDNAQARPKGRTRANDGR